MSREIKEDLLPRLKARYAKRGREGRSRMLDDLWLDYRHERNHAIKLLNQAAGAAAWRRDCGLFRFMGPY